MLMRRMGLRLRWRGGSGEVVWRRRRWERRLSLMFLVRLTLRGWRVRRGWVGVVLVVIGVLVGAEMVGRGRRQTLL